MTLQSRFRSFALTPMTVLSEIGTSRPWLSVERSHCPAYRKQKKGRGLHDNWTVLAQSPIQ
jgi:hypothetical protein